MNQKIVFLAFLMVFAAMQESHAFTAGIGNVGFSPGRKRVIDAKVRCDMICVASVGDMKLIKIRWR